MIAPRYRQNAVRIAFMLAALFIIIPACAWALGVSPASITVEHNETTSGTRVQFTITPLATGGEEGMARLHAEGDLAEHVEFATSEAPFGAPVLASVFLPADLEPGDHPQDIVVTFLPDITDGTVVANLEVATTLLVQVPYPDQYLTGSLTPNGVPGSTALLLTIMLQNRGSVPVTPENVSIAVLDGAQQVDRLFVEPSIVLPGGFAGLNAQYNGAASGAVRPGVYTFQAVIPYADRELRIAREAAIGEPRFEIIHARYGAEETGAIRPLDVKARVLWNRPVPYTVSAYVDDASDPAASISSSDLELSSRLYIDTARSGVPAGKLSVVMVADDGSQQARVEVLVPVKPPSRGSYPVLIALAVVVLSVLLFALWRASRVRASKP